MNFTPAKSGTQPSRREFVAALAAAAATPLVIAQASRAAAPMQPAEKMGATAGRQEQTGPTCLHVFSKPLHWMSYEETARLVAEAGFGGIDFSVRPGGHVKPERVREDLPRAVEAAHAAGLRVEMITTGIMRADETYTVPILETAAKLGVKYYRLGWMNYDLNIGVWNSLAKLKPVMRGLADLNQRLGIHGAYQNHSGTRVGGAGWDLFELLRDLDPRWIGCQYDIRHAVTEGGQSWPVTLRLLKPWIRCTDIKDFRWAQTRGKATVEGAPLGDGIVNFSQYFNLYRELNITGPMSVHFEHPPFEGGPEIAPELRRNVFLTAMQKDAKTLKQMMATAKIA